MTKPWNFTEKATPDDTDRFPFVVSDASGGERHATWAQIKTALDGLLDPAAHTHALADLTESGAEVGQVPKWNGEAWVPAADEIGTTPDWGDIQEMPQLIADLGDAADLEAARTVLGITDGPALAANQVSVRNAANDGFEARTQRVGPIFTLNAPDGETIPAGTYIIGPWPDIPATLTEVSIITQAGTVDVQITKGGAAINGFGSAQGASTTRADVASTETIAADALFRVVLTNASSLTGLAVTFKGVRTAS